VSVLVHRTLVLDAKRAAAHPTGRARLMRSALARCLLLLRRYVEGRHRVGDPIAPGRRYVVLGLPCPAALRALDGWLVDVLCRALRARARRGRTAPTIPAKPKAQLAAALVRSRAVPSFVRAWAAASAAGRRTDGPITPPG
jgi:hypothetical protein